MIVSIGRGRGPLFIVDEDVLDPKDLSRASALWGAFWFTGYPTENLFGLWFSLDEPTYETRSAFSNNRESGPCQVLGTTIL